MYFGNVTSLLQAIGNDRGVQTEVTHLYEPRIGDEWMVTAHSEDGQVWRIRHSNLLLAVVMLERMLKGEQEFASGDRVSCTRPSY